MKKTLYFFLLLVSLTSCLPEDVVLQSSPHIKNFSFSSHLAVPGIEKIKFTVDSINCVIYNEDSITYGADLSKMLPNIQYTGTPKKMTINGIEWNGTDSIDFTYPVKLYIQSQNKTNEATYTITLNQHQVDPEQIVWENIPAFHLSVAAKNIRCVSTQQDLYLFTENNTETPQGHIHGLTQGDNWVFIGDYTTPINTSSIEVFGNQIYALSTDGNTLYRLDNYEWQAIASFTEGAMTDIIGSIGNKLYILYTLQEQTLLASYNGSQLLPEVGAILPASFAPTHYAKLTANNIIFLLGGNANGQVQNSILSSDNGYYWTNIANQAEKFCFSARTGAAATYYCKAIYLFGGYDNAGQDITTHCYSNNNGYSWTALNSQQMPPATYSYVEGTNALTFNNYIWLVGLKEANKQQVDLWKGRIRKVDFIRQ